jgi:hypothetical protein
MAPSNPPTGEPNPRHMPRTSAANWQRPAWCTRAWASTSPIQPHRSGSARVKLPDVDTAPEGHVCKSCYNDFGADFELPADWKEQCFKFSELKQQPGWGEPQPALSTGKVFSVQWQVANTTSGDYELWVDNVRLTCD